MSASGRRLKDYRRIVTRYDKLADNFLVSVLIAAIISYWASAAARLPQR